MNIGDKIKAIVTGIKPYGVFVKTVDDKIGFLHISEISDSYVKNIEEYFSLGDELELEIIKEDEHNRLLLSSKALKSNRNRVKIHLTIGFEPLEKQLPKWISNYKKMD